MNSAVKYISMVFKNPKKWIVNSVSSNDYVEINNDETKSKVPILTINSINQIKTSNQSFDKFPRNDSKFYSNIRWAERINSSITTTYNDTTNPNLLNDINEAAKLANVIVTVTTAKEGHDRFVHGKKVESRHYKNKAVDIAIINGKGLSRNNTNDADKFVEILKSMGYSYNVETGKSKAVLWRTKGHWNHVHVSNEIS